MRPQKKSIRDFFSPVPRAAHDKQQATPPEQDTTNAHSTNTPTWNTTQNITPAASSAESPPSAANRSTLTPAPTATSFDGLPPNPSQASANSAASKRIVSNGEQVVLNSDSDSDSLPDLDWGGPKTSFKASAPVSRPKRTSEDDEHGLRIPVKKERPPNWSYNAFIERAQQNSEIELKILEGKANLEETWEEPRKTNITINEDVLGQVVGDDDDHEKAHRLFMAMQRTSATQMETVFYFFESTPDTKSVRPKFPLGSLPDHRWTSNFDNQTSRDQAFLTGLAHQIFRFQELPEEVASWMIDQTYGTQSQLLNEKYLEILELHHRHIPVLLNKAKLETIFKAIGAKMDLLDSPATLAPISEVHSARKPSAPRPLKAAVKLIQRAAPWFDNETRGFALNVLLHTCLDDCVSSNVNVLDTVQAAIEAVICSFADNLQLTSSLSATLPGFFSRISHPILQRNLICALPVRSPLTAYMQRHLALTCFLHPAEVNVPLDDPKIPGLIYKHLTTSPHFRINKRTDHGNLAARITLLDIAIGPGLRSVPYQPLITPALSPEGSSPTNPPMPALSEAKDFNREVDLLSQHIKVLGNSIVEAGAVVDLSILDAKDRIERLCARLEHAVRIGGKKVHNVFGDSNESIQPQLNKFFLKGKKSNAASASGGIFKKDDNISPDPGNSSGL